MITNGASVCFGVKPEFACLPIANLPDDTISVKRKFRPKMAALAYIRRPHSVEEWVLAPDGNAALKLSFVRKINQRQQP